MLPNLTTANSIILDNKGYNKITDGSCLLAAKDDNSAISEWLDLYKTKKTTYVAYRKEAERLLLWSIIDRKKSLAALTKDDFSAYFSFLANPMPYEVWCSEKRGGNKTRGSTDWRPFAGPLSPSAITTAKTILNSLLNFLVQARYLAVNPLGLLRLKGDQNFAQASLKARALSRMLDPDEWQAILDTLAKMPTTSNHEKDEKHRLIFIISMLYLSGIRVSELASCRWRQFVCIDSRWWLIVKGKGDKEGMVPVNKSLLAAIVRFRRWQKLSPYPGRNEDTPVVPSWRSNKALSANYIAKLLKRLAKQAALQFKDNEYKYDKLCKFSPHWLRHLSASKQSQAGIQFDNIKDNLRHSRRETTQVYVHTLNNPRHDDMEKLEFEVLP